MLYQRISDFSACVALFLLWWWYHIQRRAAERPYARRADKVEQQHASALTNALPGCFEEVVSYCTATASAAQYCTLLLLLLLRPASSSSTSTSTSTTSTDCGSRYHHCTVATSTTRSVIHCSHILILEDSYCSSTAACYRAYFPHTPHGVHTQDLLVFPPHIFVTHRSHRGKQIDSQIIDHN